MTETNHPESVPSDRSPESPANKSGGAKPHPNGAGEPTVETLRADLEATRDRLLRAQAEFDNYQKRVLRERNDERRFAFFPLLRDLLPVRDNLQRAIDAAVKSGGQADAASLLEGVKLVAQQFQTIFEQHGCQEIAAAGTEFDPHLHDALTTQPSADQPAGRVLSVFRAGYQLHDRVVRPAQVVVSSGPAAKIVE